MSGPDDSRGIVLIVEDEWIIAMDIRRIVQEAGFHVPTLVTVPEDVLSAIQDHQPEIVLMDIALSAQVDGIDLADRISEQFDVAIVFVSAHADSNTLARAGRATPGGFVVKPFSEQQLLAAVEMGLARQRSRAVSSPQPRAHEQAYRDALSRIAEVLQETGLSMDPGAVARKPTMKEIPELARLTKREWDVARTFVSIRDLNTVAKELNISPHTVRNHLKAIFTKLGVHTQKDLLAKLTGIG